MLDELFSPNVLAFPDFEAAISGSRKFWLITDASADRFGAVIEQQFNLYATSEEPPSTLSASGAFLSRNAPRSCELSNVTDKCSTASRLKSRQITSRFKISQVLPDKSNRVSRWFDFLNAYTFYAEASNRRTQTRTPTSCRVSLFQSPQKIFSQVWPD